MKNVSYDPTRYLYSPQQIGIAAQLLSCNVFKGLKEQYKESPPVLKDGIPLLELNLATMRDTIEFVLWLLQETNHSDSIEIHGRPVDISWEDYKEGHKEEKVEFAWSQLAFRGIDAFESKEDADGEESESDLCSCLKEHGSESVTQTGLTFPIMHPMYIWQWMDGDSKTPFLWFPRVQIDGRYFSIGRDSSMRKIHISFLTKKRIVMDGRYSAVCVCKHKQPHELEKEIEEAGFHEHHRSYATV